MGRHGRGLKENTGIDIVEKSCEKVKWTVLYLGIWSSGRIYEYSDEHWRPQEEAVP